jgi:acetyltransferase-like isoleucine patch superfamily enzyme
VDPALEFVQERNSPATTVVRKLQTEADRKVERTVIRKGASIGSGATIISNTDMRENALVGAGSVVTKDVPPNAIVAGNPARVLRYIEAITGIQNAKF